jgi:ribonuclease HI
MDITPIDRDVKIMTDSFYSIQCLTVWCKNWKTNGWKNSAGKPVENKDIIEPILARIRERDLCKAKTNFQWVKGHGTDVGNIGADHLATTGALKDRSVQYPEPLKVPVDGVQDLKPTGDQ